MSKKDCNEPSWAFGTFLLSIFLFLLLFMVISIDEVRISNLEEQLENKADRICTEKLVSEKILFPKSGEVEVIHTNCNLICNNNFQVEYVSADVAYVHFIFEFDNVTCIKTCKTMECVIK